MSIGLSKSHQDRKCTCPGHHTPHIHLCLSSLSISGILLWLYLVWNPAHTTCNLLHSRLRSLRKRRNHLGKQYTYYLLIFCRNQVHTPGIPRLLEHLHYTVCSLGRINNTTNPIKISRNLRCTPHIFTEWIHLH